MFRAIGGFFAERALSKVLTVLVLGGAGFIGWNRLVADDNGPPVDKRYARVERAVKEAFRNGDTHNIAAFASVAADTKMAGTMDRLMTELRAAIGGGSGTTTTEGTGAVVAAAAPTGGSSDGTDAVELLRAAFKDKGPADDNAATVHAAVTAGDTTATAQPVVVTGGGAPAPAAEASKLGTPEPPKATPWYKSSWDYVVAASDSVVTFAGEIPKGWAALLMALGAFTTLSLGWKSLQTGGRAFKWVQSRGTFPDAALVALEANPPELHPFVRGSAWDFVKKRHALTTKANDKKLDRVTCTNAKAELRAGDAIVLAQARRAAGRVARRAKRVVNATKGNVKQSSRHNQALRAQVAADDALRRWAKYGLDRDPLRVDG